MSPPPHISETLGVFVPGFTQAMMALSVAELEQRLKTSLEAGLVPAAAEQRRMCMQHLVPDADDECVEQLPELVRVRRANAEMLVGPAEVVPGDLVLLAPGDRAPADLRLVWAAGPVMAGSDFGGDETSRHPEAPAAFMVFAGEQVLDHECHGLALAIGVNCAMFQPRRNK